MKTLLAAFAATTVLATAFVGSASAADRVLDPVAAPDVYRYFVAIKGGYGPSPRDNDFESADGTGTSGRFEDDYIVGGSIEAGAFVTERLRFSVELNYGRIEHDRQIINGGAFRLDGGTNLTQVFVKGAYEMPLADLGLNAPIFERSSLVALGGIGFTHINSGGTVRGVPFSPGGTTPFFLDGRQEEEDTVFSAKLGLGSVYRLTDRVDFVSETSFIFGSEAELSSDFGLATSTSNVDTNAIVSQIGLRFKF